MLFCCANLPLTPAPPARPLPGCSTDGHMERTVDMLLTMETPPAVSQARPADNFARPAPAPSPFEPSPPAQPAHYGGGGGGGSGGGMGMGSGSGAPASTGSHGSGSGGYILPEDFLRVREPRPALVARLINAGRARASEDTVSHAHPSATNPTGARLWRKKRRECAWGRE
jgi:hypothetical protein